MEESDGGLGGFAAARAERFDVFPFFEIYSGTVVVNGHNCRKASLRPCLGWFSAVVGLLPEITKAFPLTRQALLAHLSRSKSVPVLTSLRPRLLHQPNLDRSPLRPPLPHFRVSS